MLIGGAEASVAKVRAVLVVHAMIVPAVLAIALGIGARRGRSVRGEPAAP